MRTYLLAALCLWSVPSSAQLLFPDLSRAREEIAAAQKRAAERRKEEDWWKPLQERQAALEKLRGKVEPAIFQVEGEDGEAGAGFIIDTSGLALTADHAANSDEVTVRSDHMRAIKARVVARAPERDIAILQLEGKRADWPALKFGDYSQVQRMQPVFSFGNPLNFGVAAHQGLIQRCDNDKVNPYAGCVQTSVSNGPGDSGGPLVNIRGEVIGMNTTIPLEARDMSFSIRGDVLQKALAEYRKDKELADYGIDAEYTLGSAQGSRGIYIVILRAPKDSVLQADDILLSVDGAALPRTPGVFAEFQRRIAPKGKGGNVILRVQRAGKVEDVSAPLTKLCQAQKVVQRLGPDQKNEPDPPPAPAPEP